ncbi:MAG: phage holin family protein [Solirubrobacteraceae bacterium]
MATDNSQNVAETVQEISERVSVLVREEIELAKAEVTEKVTKLIKAIVVAVAAGIFAVTGLMFFLHGLAWLAWFALPVGDNSVFWGFFVVALLLLLLGGLAGFLAARFFKESTPPVPEMAIDGAGKIKKALRFVRKSGWWLRAARRRFAPRSRPTAARSAPRCSICRPRSRSSPTGAGSWSPIRSRS